MNEVLFANREMNNSIGQFEALIASPLYQI
jgi:hypothetical protein